MPQNAPTADELRSVARYLEETAAEVTFVAEEAPPPREIKGAQFFPRSEPESRGLAQETGVVQEETTRVIATLLEFAAAIDAGADVPPVLLLPVQPYIDAYRAAQR